MVVDGACNLYGGGGSSELVQSGRVVAMVEVIE